MLPTNYQGLDINGLMGSGVDADNESKTNSQINTAVEMAIAGLLFPETIKSVATPKDSSGLFQYTMPSASTGEKTEPVSGKLISGYLLSNSAENIGSVNTTNSYFTNLVYSYLESRERNMTDLTDKVPPKTVHKQPWNWMGGVLGYTVRNEGWIVLRDDLHGDMKNLVDVHESIHTNNEYETRVITSWMLSKEKPRMKQY